MKTIMQTEDGRGRLRCRPQTKTEDEDCTVGLIGRRKRKRRSQAASKRMRETAAATRRMGEDPRLPAMPAKAVQGKTANGSLLAGQKHPTLDI